MISNRPIRVRWARTRIGLAMTTRPTNGESNRTIALVVSVSSMMISSSGVSLVANCNGRLRSRPILPASRILPYSDCQLSEGSVDIKGNDPHSRLLSRPTTMGAGGLHDNHGSSLAEQPGKSKGRSDNNSSSQLMK